MDKYIIGRISKYKNNRLLIPPNKNLFMNIKLIEQCFEKYTEPAGVAYRGGD